MLLFKIRLQDGWVNCCCFQGGRLRSTSHLFAEWAFTPGGCLPIEWKHGNISFLTISKPSTLFSPYFSLGILTSESIISFTMPHFKINESLWCCICIYTHITVLLSGDLFDSMKLALFSKLSCCLELWLCLLHIALEYCSQLYIKTQTARQNKAAGRSCTLIVNSIHSENNLFRHQSQHNEAMLQIYSSTHRKIPVQIRTIMILHKVPSIMLS